MNRCRPLFFIVILLTFHCSPKYAQAPKLIKNSLVFIYPSEARDKHLEGTVVLKVLISEKGAVEDAEVDRSSGYDILDQTALNVAKTAKFKPAKIGGKERSVWITWPLVFEISSMKFIPEEWIDKALDYQWEATSNSDTKRQLAMLRHVSGLLKKNGVLVYSVCSTEPEETVEIVKEFLNINGDFYIINNSEFMERFKLSISRLINDAGHFFTYPHIHNMDGFFAVRLSRR